MPNIADCKKILNTTPAEQAILFYGEKGTGKSEVQEQIAKEQGMKYKVFFLGEMQDAGDIIGLMIPDPANGRSIHLMGDWFPEGDQPVYLHLDEINRAKPELFGTINNLVLRREINGKKLPAGSRIVATINPPDDRGDYDVEEMDEALKSRFNIYEWRMDYTDWRAWAVENKVHPLILKYLDNNPDRLNSMKSVISGKKGDGNSESKRDWKSSDARSWNRVSEYMNHNVDLWKNDYNFFLTAICGVIGMVDGSRFCTYVKDNAKELTAKEILLAKPEALYKIIEDAKNMSIQELGLLNGQFEMYFESNYTSLTNEKGEEKMKKVLKNFKDFMNSIPMDIFAEFASRVLQNVESGVTEKIRWSSWLLGCLPKTFNAVMSIEEAKAA